ncbi:MAG: FAD-dependent oxidoreductase [Planctomycetota bacterium]|nr:FAD-dependent oxidoreductase [Planctomycetota bacterium]
MAHFFYSLLISSLFLSGLAEAGLLAGSACDIQEADVIVYGSTPGGVCAAIAAAREGASVILLEPTDHVGGMSTGGLSHCDSNQMVRKTLMGLFDEWHKRVVKDYTDRGQPAPYDPTRKNQATWTFEPHVAMRVTRQMLDEAGVKVLPRHYLQSVQQQGPRITSLVTKQGAFAAKVFIDGTYEGDLMAAAGVDWVIGREGRSAYGESLAGKQYPKPKMEIDGFDDKGNLLPLLTTDDAGPDAAGGPNVMTYSFRLCLTTDPKNRVPLPEPDHYEPARFEIMRRALAAGHKGIGFDRYRLPGGKLDGNNSIGRQFSIGLVGGGNDWHTADEAGRQKIWEAHKQYTLEFIHFLRSDPAVPLAIRKQYAELGLCKDEFAAYDHFSPALYVRESRRMRGLHVISQKDILEEPEKQDPIAISSFPIDSHDVQRIAIKGGGVINEGTIFPVRRKEPKQGYAYHVPYRAILPRPEQATNLLVPVALSCTHVGISSLRIEGAWMVIGQGAGVAAALAAQQNVSVQQLDYRKLRERLLAQGQVLDLPPQPGAAQPPSLPTEPETFQIAGRPAFVMEPPVSMRRPGPLPWIWYAPTLPGLPSQAESWMFERFQRAGIAIAGIDVGESYGSPNGTALYQKLYEELTGDRNYARQPVLLARSRGGLMLYNWAVEHPDAVAGLAGIYPVCNLASYPGLDRAAPAYEMTTDQLRDRLAQQNPVDRLTPLAEARVPLFHIHGDRDKVVPLEQNSALLAKRYRELGGPVELEVVAGQGHNMWRGWFESQALVDFVIAQAVQTDGD